MGEIDQPAPAEEAPAEAPVMEEAPAEEKEPVLTEQDQDITATADAKAFPSEHDMSGHKLEVAESDGKKHLIIKKDVKSKIQRKLKNHFKGAFHKGEAICVDFGDYIETGTVTAYLGDGKYKVAMNDGRALDVPSGNLFRISKKLWGE